MKSTRARYRLWLFASLFAVTACGLNALGEAPNQSADETEAADGGKRLDSAGDPGARIGYDVQARCLEVCEGGTCDAGWCSFDCAEAGACPQKVACPPGVFCNVACGNNACDGGVDCSQALGCNVGCRGAGSCAGPVACSGEHCEVDCVGGNACAHGVACDAGSCDVQCGADAGGANGKAACAEGVQCTAGSSCAIACLADNSCQGQIVATVSDGGATVRCTGAQSCNAHVSATASDTTISCQKNGTCAGDVACDGGRCLIECANDDSEVQFCCTGLCSKDLVNCPKVTSGCGE